MGVTLNDIAKLTGVDAGSVSRILRNHPRAKGLNAETRERVLAEAKKLGYRRNELAATIRTGANRTIAIVGKFIDSSFPDDFNIIVSGVLREATKLDYGLKLYTDDDLGTCFDEMLSHQIKYVLSMSVDTLKRTETAALCRQYNLKLVFVYETSVGEFPAVTTAEKDAVRDTVLYLSALEHKRIAFVCGPHRFSYVTERHEGYLQGVREAGFELMNELITCGEDMMEREITVEKMLSFPQGKRPTAFICIADSLAMMVQRAALKKKLRLPKDVSVIGFGNSHLANFAVSPITSLAQPFMLIGETAVKVLIGEKCDCKPDAQNRYLLPATLIERESVALPCAENRKEK